MLPGSLAKSSSRSKVNITRHSSRTSITSSVRWEGKRGRFRLHICPSSGAPSSRSHFGFALKIVQCNPCQCLNSQTAGNGLGSTQGAQFAKFVARSAPSTDREIVIDGRNVAVASVDPTRAPHIVRGFELYATGQYTGRQVVDMLGAAGLRTRGTRKTPPGPLSLGQFYDILADRYYTGVVEYQGEEYPGRHAALISADLFDPVQRVLALHGGGGTRGSVHNHYLKGALWCGRCGRRLIIMRGRGNGGIYFYFICRGRQGDGCTQPYLRVEAMEAVVARHYATVRLSDEFQTRIRAELDDALLGELGSVSAMKRRLTTRPTHLDTKENHYLELVGSPGWPKQKLQRKLDRIRADRGQISEQLADA